MRILYPDADLYYDAGHVAPWETYQAALCRSSRGRAILLYDRAGNATRFETRLPALRRVLREHRGDDGRQRTVGP